MNVLQNHALWTGVRAEFWTGVRAEFWTGVRTEFWACRLPIPKHGNMFNTEIIISRKIL